MYMWRKILDIYTKRLVGPPIEPIVEIWMKLSPLLQASKMPPPSSQVGHSLSSCLEGS